MYRTHLLYLSLYIYTLCASSYGTATDNLASALLLPNSLTAFSNYKVLSVRQESDKDVIQIRRRAEEKDCETDCMTYTA
jgi:hypothetical protein